MPATEQPKVVVKIPEIRLQLEDVAYLRSLTAPNGVQCALKRDKLDRLKLLGLIEEKPVPPTEKELAKFQAELDTLCAEVRNALDQKKWNLIDGYRLRRVEEKMKPQTKTVLTEAGQALLKQGTVTVKMSKRGCA